MTRTTPAQSRLLLDDPARPVPTRPSLFVTTGRQADELTFDTVKQLAAQVVHMAGDAPGLRISDRAWPCAFPGYEPFQAWSIYALAVDGSESWIASAAIQTTPRELLQAALRLARDNAVAAQAEKAARAAA